MKIVANSLRVISGLLLIFSGFIKTNDPKGFAIKLEEYFNVFATDLTPAQEELTIQIEDSENHHNFLIKKPLHGEDSKELNLKTEAWEHVEVKDESGLNKSYSDKTTLSLSLDHEVIWNSPVLKSDTKPYRYKVEVKVKDKILHTKQLILYNNKDISEKATLDLKAFAKEEGYAVKSFKTLSHYTLVIAMLICVFEILLGMALLIGWKKNLTLSLLLLLLIFFSLLTWYSAQYNKVTDCGCFGNAIPLSPWQSFAKDILLLIFLLIIIAYRKYIKPVFSPQFSWKLLVFFAALSTGFAIYCWYYLPVFNFLKFKVGNDIKALMQLPANAKTEKREMRFIYSHARRDEEFSEAELIHKNILDDSTYVFKQRIDKVLEKGDKPAISDFVMLDRDGNNYVDTFLNSDEFKLLVVSEKLISTRPRRMKKLSKISNEWVTKSKFEIWALTCSAPEEAEAIRHEYQLPFKFYYGDQTNIKSIIRSNPGLLLFKGSVVIGTWPSTDLPSYKELMRKLK